ncbi:MAG: phosphate transport system protein [Cognaticolwellia sp.]|mgnify:CR=1 FL=1|jgi:phosphate transport system protein
MTNLETQLEALKDQVVGMMQLVRTQLANANTAFLKKNDSLAREVIHYENRVNAMELSIDKECEMIFALYKPVAIDLRFVIAALKMNTQLERIGDHAKAIAEYTLQMEKPFEKKLLKKLRFNEMVETVLSMIDDAIHAFNFENTKLARWIFGKDATINEINKHAFVVITTLVKEDPSDIERFLMISSTIRKLERVGDLVKNVAEETVFYTEAKVLKHKSKK